MLYQLTMDDKDPYQPQYSEQVFEAPSNILAENFARKFPTTNGWSSGTHWTVGRYYPLAIDETGLVCNSALMSQFAEGWT